MKDILHRYSITIDFITLTAEAITEFKPLKLATYYPTPSKTKL